MNTEPKKVIAAFDFDGTLTDRDSTLYFLFFSAGFIKTVYLLATKLPILCAFLLGIAPRQTAKEAIFAAFFGGKSLSYLKQLGENFALQRVSKYLRPAALEKLQWHQQQGHRCILISASLDVYLYPWAKLYGFNDILTTRLSTDSMGNVSGKLLGLNCHGPEKVERLKELVGKLSGYEIYAYGDSDGDKELLAIANHPFLADHRSPTGFRAR